MRTRAFYAVVYDRGTALPRGFTLTFVDMVASLALLFVLPEPSYHLPPGIEVESNGVSPEKRLTPKDRTRVKSASSWVKVCARPR
jgi:hypothetical protein